MTQSERPQFGLTGPSIALDARTHAVRGDLADIALAGKLFVPHYARPMEMVCTTAGVSIHEGADVDSAVVAPLDAGAAFLVVDMAGDWAWGFRKADHLVGYVPKAVLDNGQ
ncbi:hypothetical protein D5I55_17050 [Chakrabartia godavariana]|nr:hypothetical protein D5I55_17050 [Chakrabartia godavariana]